MQIHPSPSSAQTSFGAELNSPPSFSLHSLSSFPPAEIIRLFYAAQATQKGDFLCDGQHRDLSILGLQEPLPHPKPVPHPKPRKAQRSKSQAEASVVPRWPQLLSDSGKRVSSRLSAVLRAAGCTQYKRHTKRGGEGALPGGSVPEGMGEIFSLVRMPATLGKKRRGGGNELW